MHVAYLINQYPKVSHTFIRREIRALERLGTTVMRISIRGWNQQLVDEDDLEERKRTRYVLRDGALALLLAFVKVCLSNPVLFVRALIHELRMARRSDRPLLAHLVYVAEACRIRDWLKCGNVTHLHAHFGTNSAEVAMLVGMLGGPPWSFTVHGPEEFDRAPAIGLAEKIRQAAFVVAICSFGRSQLYRLVDHSYWSKIHVVRCGLDSNFLDAVSDQAPSPRRLICVGRICEAKGQLLLLEAARSLADKGVDFELVLAGDGEMRPEAEALIHAYKLESKVRITGWITNDCVREEILAARALVLPSFAEGLPVVIMEAMALGRPVISTFVAGIPELVRDHENGWLIPSSDVEALVEAIERCLTTPLEAVQKMGNNGFQEVLRFHTVDREVPKLSELYHGSIKDDRASRTSARTLIGQVESEKTDPIKPVVASGSS